MDESQRRKEQLQADGVFLQKSHDIIVDILSKEACRETKVLDFKTPEELSALMDFNIEDSGASREKMLDLFSLTAQYSVQNAHPRYFYQLQSGRSLEGLSASCLVEALNTNVHTFESAPVFTVAEQYIVRELCKKVGYENGDGAFMAGGTMCNFTAIHLARFNHNKLIKEHGMIGQPRQTLFATRDAHFSVTKAAELMGFGSDSVVFVESDQYGCMLPGDLEKQIRRSKEQGQEPVCVIATSGSTVYGSFDPLRPLVDISRRHGCWFHVDACWGGSTIFSDKHKHLIDGIEMADSACFSFHKMMEAQVQCAVLLVKQKGQLSECNSVRASYLFQSDKDYYKPENDIGIITVQCGRKADGFKFLALWMSRGHSGFRRHVDDAFEKTRYFVEKLRRTEGFQLVLPQFQFVNVCFWYVPSRLRDQPQTAEWWLEMSKVAPKIKSKTLYSGSVAIGYQPMESRNQVNFFRIIIDNPATTEADLDFVLEEIHRLGEDL